MIRSISICGLCSLLLAILSLTSFGDRLERNIGLGLLYAARGNLTAPEGALVIGLDRASIGWLQRNIDDLDRMSDGLHPCLPAQAREALGRARSINQVPRALYACLIHRLDQRSARVIVFDINFNSETPDDVLLAEAMRKAGNVLLLERVQRSDIVQRLRPSALLSDAARQTVFFQTDGVNGRIATGYPTRSRFFPMIPTMPVQAWRDHVGEEIAVADPQQNIQLIWLYGPAGTVPTVPLRGVFEMDGEGLPADLSRLSVFVGAFDVAGKSGPDQVRVALMSARSDLIGGAELAATAFLNLLHGERMASLPPPARAGIVFHYALAVLLVSRFASGRRALGGVTAIAVAYAAAAGALFVVARFWIPVSFPLVIVTPIATLSALSARFAVARQVIERLAPRPFAHELLTRPGISRDHSSIEQATVVFADMVDSTALAERLDDDVFKELMNRYYSAATAAVEANDGMVVEYLGDGVLALFTAGVAGPEHATKACLAAQQISASRLRRSDSRDAGAAERFRLRFGIHSGNVVIGPTGAEHRYSFKALGESVIVAARLQEHGRSLTQDGADIILLTAHTRRRTCLPDAQLQSLGKVKLRGRAEELEIYRMASGPAHNLGARL